MRAKEFIIEYNEKNKIAGAILDFYKNNVGEIEKQPVDNYIEKAKELINNAPSTIKDKVVSIFNKSKDNPYVQGGVVTTIGALLAGGVLNSAQKMGLSPAQTNVMLQIILNTVIPTVVSRINGKNWSDTIKYTLASAGIGTGIATMFEDDYRNTP